MKLQGEEYEDTLIAANNYAISLCELQRCAEAKALLRKSMRVARRVLGENNETTLNMRKIYAKALCKDPAATLDDLREAVTTLEDAERTMRRVFGGEHPFTKNIEGNLRNARALAASDVEPLREAVGAMGV